MLALFTLDWNHLIEVIEWEMSFFFGLFLRVLTCVITASQLIFVPACSHTLAQISTWSGGVEDSCIHGHFPMQQLALCSSKTSVLSVPACSLAQTNTPAVAAPLGRVFNLHHCQQAVILWLLCPVTRPAWSAGNLQTITRRNRFYYHFVCT